MMKRVTQIAIAAIVCAAALVAPARAEEKAKAGEAAKATAETGQKKVKWVNAVKSKPLSKNVKRGLAWLVKQQLPSGAWGQGEESVHMGQGLKLKDVPSVADTCVAALALIRSGSTPAKGPHAKNVLKAVQFVCAELEKPPKDALYVTKTRGTRVQAKLGPFIDTFLASLLLNEVQDNMPDEKTVELASAALDKVLHKIQKNQRKDGTWGNQGWAPVLAQGIAVKGMNMAAQSGRKVSREALANAEGYSQKQFNVVNGSFGAAGSAGVQLYTASSNAMVLRESARTNAMKIKVVETKLKGSPTAADKKQLSEELARLKKSQKVADQADQAVIKKLQDKRFIAGFGSNGGEEFLSYLNIGEGLIVKAGEPWKKWDKKMTENMNRIQNKDGSWTGHHCITGRTFCTSAALLVLTVDRTKLPIAAEIKKR